MNIIMLGSPGAGKGTQAQTIAKKYNLKQLSTGDLLREEIKNKTDIGKEIEHIISKGEFATDYIVNELLKKTIIKTEFRNNIIFDGYPRNINQAKNLDLIINSDNQSLNFIIFLKVTKEIIEKRILGRLICENCNHIFNEFDNSEELEKICCNSKKISKRKDDNLQAIINRYDEYTRHTKPVLDFYSARNNYFEIDGGEKIEVITAKIEEIFKA